jgi:hypothetical protein
MILGLAATNVKAATLNSVAVTLRFSAATTCVQLFLSNVQQGQQLCGVKGLGHVFIFVVDALLTMLTGVPSCGLGQGRCFYWVA